MSAYEDKIKMLEQIIQHDQQTLTAIQVLLLHYLSTQPIKTNDPLLDIYTHQVTYFENLRAIHQAELTAQLELRKINQADATVVKPIAGEAWRTTKAYFNFFLQLCVAGAIGVGKLLSPLVEISKTIVKPIDLIISGFTGAWDLYKTIQDKAAGQRKTKMGVAITRIGLALTGVVFLLTALNPIGAAMILVGLMGAGLYQDSYISQQTRKKIETCQDEIALLKAQLAHLNDHPNSPQAAVEKLQLENQLNAATLRLPLLKKSYFESRHNIGYSLVSAIGLACTIGGLFFPPLLLVGASILLATGIVKAIDHKINYKITNIFIKNNITNSPHEDTIAEQPIHHDSTQASMEKLGKLSTWHAHITEPEKSYPSTTPATPQNSSPQESSTHEESPHPEQQKNTQSDLTEIDISSRNRHH